MPNWMDAQLIMPQVKVITLDNQHRILTAEVPGKGGRYYVRLEREKATIWCRCTRYGDETCLGNKNGICYHCLATILVSIERAKVKADWYENKAEAEWEQGDGKLFYVISDQSDKQIYGVLRKMP